MGITKEVTMKLFFLTVKNHLAILSLFADILNPNLCRICQIPVYQPSRIIVSRKRETNINLSLKVSRSQMYSVLVC